MPSISIIAAVSKNRVIGDKNQLIWKISADLKRFKSITTGHTIVMGRKTFESIGRALPGRRNIIITRNLEYEQTGCEVVNSIDKAIKLTSEYDEVFIIGGAEIYAQTLTLASKLYLTHVDDEFNGDAFFPLINDDEWIKEEIESNPKSENVPLPYSFINYIRK